jgi:hypothetical protein
MTQHSTHDFQGIMAQIAEAVRRRVRGGHLEFDPAAVERGAEMILARFDDR